MSKLVTESTRKNLVKWGIVLVLFAFSIIAGVLGFQKYFNDIGKPSDGLRPLYRTIQLFTSEGGDFLKEPVPRILLWVRLTAPLTTLITVLLTLLVVFSDQLKRLWISLLRNHVVIIGLGTKGKNVVKENLEDNERVLVIEKDPQNPNLATLKPRKPHLIIGDSTNINILKRARIKHAKKVYLLMGDDSQQITACLLIYDMIKKSRKNKKRKGNQKSIESELIKRCELSELVKMKEQKKQIRLSELSELCNQSNQSKLYNQNELSRLSEVCVLCEKIKENNQNSTKRVKKHKDSLECNLHIKKTESLHILRNNRLVKNTNDKFSLNVFSVYENAARDLYQNHPPDLDGLSASCKKFVQLIIFGFGQAGEALALQAALNGNYLNSKKSPPRVVVFDRKATELVDDFITRYPKYEKYCKLIPISMDVESPLLLTELGPFLETPDALNTVVLCFDSRTKNMLLGLQIDNLIQPQSEDSDQQQSIPIQIFSRTDDDEAFIGLTNNIMPYSKSSSVCSKDAIQGIELDKMAKAYHKNYLEIRRQKDDFGKGAADFCWEELSQEYQDSNRKAADHIGVKLRGIGFTIASKKDDRDEVDNPETKFSLLYELEHRRWNAERFLAGWTHAEEKNNLTRQTPYLVDWKELDPDIKKYDIEAVDSIPAILGIAEQKIVESEKICGEDVK